MTALSGLGQAALRRARNGWPVFPCEKRGKKPLCEHGFEDASTNEETIIAWWTRWPDANIGYPTKRYVVLDVDGEEGERALSDLEAEHGKLPETLTAKTGKGRHLYFAPNGTRIRSSAGKLGPHLDIRAEGGYVILPPSVHSSGRKYQWLNKDKPALWPAWIPGLLSEPSEERGESVTGKILQGQRNAHLTSHAGSMRRRDMSASAIEAALLQENKLRCDPPLPESEVRRIAQSVGRYAPTKPGDPPPIPGVLASDVTPQSVAWLWPNHIPLGKVTLFDGDPDLAKSTVSLDLAARVTRGLPMPDGTEPGCSPGGVVIVSLEDGVADTIRPRLEAAGAALENVRIVSVITGADGVGRTPTLPIDLPAIESAIQSVNGKLLVLDPFVAMLGAETNSYRDQDIRRVLVPLAALAEKTGVAVICIRHLNKGGGQNPKYRGGGSIGIIGAARAAFLFGEKPGEEGRYVFAPNKGNLWRGKPAALEYSVEDRDGQPVIVWLGASVHNAASLLAQPENAEESNACGEAKGFLSEFLADGPHPVGDIKSEARRAGISDRTLIRARYQLGVRAKKVGFGNGQYWEWGLPKEANRPAKSANNGNLASFEQPNETKPDISTSSPKNAKTQNMAPFTAEEGNLRGGPEAPPRTPFADDTEVL
jgi:Bifunctional DNA primase/polymerase, N-terminal/AAA domain/Primase C terminal 1 (PriCT-1)